MDEYQERLTQIKKEINNLIWMYCDANMTLKEAEERACRAYRAIIDGGVTLKGGE